MAAIKECPQVLEKLSQVRRLDKAFQFQVLHPLAKKYIHIFRNKCVKALSIALKNAVAVRVEGSGKNGRFALEPLFHAFLQLGSSVLSKRDSQYLFRLRMSLLNQSGNTFHQHGGLTGTGASQHQHRPGHMLNRLFLLRIWGERARRHVFWHYDEYKAKGATGIVRLKQFFVEKKVGTCVTYQSPPLSPQRPQSPPSLPAGWYDPTSPIAIRDS